MLGAGTLRLPIQSVSLTQPWSWPISMKPQTKPIHRSSQLGKSGGSFRAKKPRFADPKKRSKPFLKWHADGCIAAGSEQRRRFVVKAKIGVIAFRGKKLAVSIPKNAGLALVDS